MKGLLIVNPITGSKMPNDLPLIIDLCSSSIL